MAEIALGGVTKVFADGTEAVHSLDLQIPDGKLIVLVGPSGCGKTTVLRMVAGLEDLTRGGISIGGRGVTGGRARGGGARVAARVAGEPAGFLAGGAALEPGREAARADASRDPAHPEGSPGDDDLRYARSDRSDDARRPGSGDQEGRPAAGRVAP